MIPASFDIARLHAAYREGLAPVEAIRDAFRRIRGAQDGIFLSLVPEDEAVSAAERLGAFDPVAKPLWGLPFAVKDNIDLAGLPTTAACPDFAYVPQASAAAVERLVAAVPVRLDGGLPLGVQIIAAPWREDVALRIARALERDGVARAPVASLEGVARGDQRSRGRG